MNQCNFIGRLTKTPEIKTTPNGKSVCNFTLAVERRFKGADGKPIVDFLDFVAWEHNAEFLGRYFDKGVRIAVQGELQTRLYKDKDEKSHKDFEVLVKEVESADGKAQEKEGKNTKDNTNTTNETDAFPVVPNENDLPF